jgi:predicted Zn-dependent peptidase
MINRLIPPVIKDAVEFDLQLKPCQVFTLNNGAKVYAIDAGQTEVISIDFVFAAGNCFENKKNMAAAVNSLLKNGTSAKTAFQINEHFEYYGAHLTLNCYNETATVTISSLTKFLPKLLPVIHEILTDAVFPDTELEIYKQNNKQRLSVNLKKCDFVASRLMDAYVYGEDHPYGKYSHAEDYDALNAEELRAYYQTYYKNGACTIFAAGKLPADMLEQLNSNFGELNLKNLPADFGIQTPTPAAGKKYRIQNDQNGVQGAIRMARHFPNRHHPDFMKVMVLNTLFGGYFGSRLMGNIREEKGYTYGIHSYVQNHLQETAWFISTEAGKDVCEATIGEVYKEMQLLREELVDEEELLLVRNYLIGTILGDLDGPFQIMGRWKNILLNGMDESYFYRSIDTIKKISAEELRELAKKYLNPEDFYELVVI